MGGKLFCSLLLMGLFIFPIIAFAESDGFRGIKWGTDISTLNDMQYLRTDTSYGGIKLYARKGDELKIGGATLKRIEYGFWQGKCSNVIIHFEGYVNFSYVQIATFEKFGSGFKPNQFMERYSWNSEMTSMMLDYNEVSKEGYLYMISKEISKQQEQYVKDNAKKGAEKDF